MDRKISDNQRRDSLRCRDGCNRGLSHLEQAPPWTRSLTASIYWAQSQYREATSVIRLRKGRSTHYTLFGKSSVLRPDLRKESENPLGSRCKYRRFLYSSSLCQAMQCTANVTLFHAARDWLIAPLAYVCAVTVSLVVTEKSCSRSLFPRRSRLARII